MQLTSQASYLLLTIMQKLNPLKITNIFLGYLYYRNKPVNTYECSALICRDSNRTILESTIDSLNQAEKAHVTWLNELEKKHCD